MQDENTINLTQNDIKVMSLISNVETGIGFSKSKGTTIDEIKSKIDDISESKIRNALMKLVQNKYVDFGIKKGKKNTYHITPEGVEFIREIKKSVIIIEETTKE